MKKVRLGIEETLTYRRSMMIEIPEGMDGEKLEVILTQAERESDSAEDLPYMLRSAGIKVLESPDANFDSPWDVDLDIDELDILDDKKNA